MNTSVLNTDLTVSVDWLAFTVTDPAYDVRSVMEFLGFDVSFFHDTGHGAMGYKSLHKLGDYAVSVLSDGREDMGIHVSIGGSAVSHVLQSFWQSQFCFKQPFSDDLGADWDSVSDGALRSFLRSVLEIGRFTRIDLALDDRKVHFTPDNLRQYVHNNQIVSKFRRGRRVEEFEIATDKRTGDTFYLGSRQSDTMLRVYDKQLEHNNKHPEDLVDTPWIRWEFEFLDKRACGLAQTIIDTEVLGDVFFQVLNNYVRIIVHDDSNRSRCSMLKEWAEFITTVQKLSLYCPPTPKTLEDKKNWVIQQVLPTLTGIIIADGYKLDIIMNYWDDSIRRMSPGMVGIVESALRKAS